MKTRNWLRIARQWWLVTTNHGQKTRRIERLMAVITANGGTAIERRAMAILAEFANLSTGRRVA